MDSPVISYISKNRKIIVAILLLLLGIVLIFSSSVSRSEKQTDESRDVSLDEYKASLEKQVASLCSAVEGVGECKVFITLERGEQNVYKGSSVIETKPPRVLGVSVICKGAESDLTRQRLTEMMTALFDIVSNIVAILKLNS